MVETFSGRSSLPSFFSLQVHQSAVSIGRDVVVHIGAEGRIHCGDVGRGLVLHDARDDAVVVMSGDLTAALCLRAVIIECCLLPGLHETAIFFQGAQKRPSDVQLKTCEDL